MSKQIKAVETRGNGYRCDCCSRIWEDDDWIEIQEMTPIEELYYQALGMDPSNNFATVGMQYYDKYDNGIYGFSSMYTRDSLTVHFSIGEQDFLLRDNDEVFLSEEEVMTQYENFIKNKGENEL